jgi:CRISPR-associated endonuclease Cas3-HD
MASRTESLEDHLDKCIEMLMTFYLKQELHRHIARSLNLSPEEAEQALKAVILLHDYGKGAQEYQQRKLLSFPKHEYFSAVAANQTLIDISWKDIAITTILWHHMAMRGPNLKADLGTWSEYNAPEIVTFTEDVEKMIQKLIKKWAVSVIDIHKLPKKITFNDVRNIVNLVDSKLREPFWSKSFYPITIKLLRTLILVDNLAAAEQRGGLQKVFVKDLPRPDEVEKARKWLQELINRQSIC